jgi:DNA-cytosine methyltransferase
MQTMKFRSDGIKVLSVFDGISCGQLALERAGIKVEKYYASEIDKYAIQVTQKNFPDTIQLGDVTKVEGWMVGRIDLFMGGSPCQGFSFAGKQLNFSDPRSKLFFEYVRILKELREINPDIIFLLENVKMKKEYQDIISKELGVEPIEINSALVSAQNRKRLYWTNIKSIVQPIHTNEFLKDILLPTDFPGFEKLIHSKEAIEYMSRKIKSGRTHWDFGHNSDIRKDKSQCLTATIHKGVPYNVLIDFVGGIESGRRLDDGKNNSRNFREGYRIYSDKLKSATLTSSSKGGPGGYSGLYLTGEVIRKLHPIECERLQTIPDNYTKGVSDTQRYKAIGNGWNVDTISHIFSFAK